MNNLVHLILIFLFLQNILFGQGSGNALKFDGQDDYVVINHSESLNITKAVTMEAWIYPTSVSSTGGDVAILSKDALPGGSGNYSYALSFSFEKGLRCSFNNFSADLFTPDNTIKLNEWTHVACTYDGDSIIAYINGESISSKAYSADIFSNNNPLYLGVWYLNNGVYSFIGIMDEIRVWNYARSKTEIQSAMNIGLSDSDSGLVGYWKFDEGVGNTTGDGSGSGNTGSLVNGPQWVSSNITSIGAYPNISPNEIILYGNYPNPFNPQTTIRYQLQKSDKVNLAVFDNTGKKIIQLVNQPQSAGLHSVRFDASNLSSGVYFYKLSTTTGFVQSRKMVVLR